MASIYRVLDTAQSWGVVSLVGACIGLNAAIMAIVTAWLSDLKLGYCRQVTFGPILPGWVPA